MTRTLPLLAAALLGTGLTQLRAADLDGGVQVGLTFPVGDLKDKFGVGTHSDFGAHVGGHMDITFTPHHELRPHLTFNYLPGSRWGADPAGWGNVAVEYRILQVGADYVFNLQGPQRGPYLLAGASATNVWASFDGAARNQDGRLGLRAGGGWHFGKPFSLEAHYNQVTVNPNGANAFGAFSAGGYSGLKQLGWVQASAVWRF